MFWILYLSYFITTVQKCKDRNEIHPLQFELPTAEYNVHVLKNENT
jgi:hypothetical protein